MANNRMWLVHRPSELAVMLGKRMAWGWYRPPPEDMLRDFYQYLSENFGEQDDFVLAMEDCAESSCAGNWRYGGETPEGFMRIIFVDEEPEKG